jgi:hypothetical protein
MSNADASLCGVRHISKAGPSLRAPAARFAQDDKGACLLKKEEEKKVRKNGPCLR